MCTKLEKNQCSDGTKKPVLLCVSFGTSYHDTRRVTIDAIERSLQKKSRFEKQGYTVTALLKGMGEYSAIREMIVEHAHEALLND